MASQVNEEISLVEPPWLTKESRDIQLNHFMVDKNNDLWARGESKVGGLSLGEVVRKVDTLTGVPQFSNDRIIALSSSYCAFVLKDKGQICFSGGGDECSLVNYHSSTLAVVVGNGERIMGVFGGEIDRQKDHERGCAEYDCLRSRARRKAGAPLHYRGGGLLSTDLKPENFVLTKRREPEDRRLEPCVDGGGDKHYPVACTYWYIAPEAGNRKYYHKADAC